MNSFFGCPLEGPCESAFQYPDAGFRVIREKPEWIRIEEVAKHGFSLGAHSYNEAKRARESPQTKTTRTQVGEPQSSGVKCPPYKIASWV